MRKRSGDVRILTWEGTAINRRGAVDHIDRNASDERDRAQKEFLPPTFANVIYIKRDSDDLARRASSSTERRGEIAGLRLIITRGRVTSPNLYVRARYYVINTVEIP